MILYLLLTIFFVIIQGIFALFEMGCVSYNRIRLQYDVSRKDKKAIWISSLLSNPSRLFGTTLIGLNTALQIGSECARRFYEAIHFDPDFAPITQVLIVVIFGELVPMLAARRYPEKAARSLVWVMVHLAYLFTPITWGFSKLARFIHWLMKKPIDEPLFLNREEVRLAFEEREKERWKDVVSILFQLKNQTAGQVMIPLHHAQIFSTQTTIRDAKEILSKKFTPILPIYHRTAHNIVAISYVRDFLLLSETDRILDRASPPWFVTKDTSILRLLDQFRRSNQSAAVILDATGAACGILTLDQITDFIFGAEGEGGEEEEIIPFVHRTLSGSMLVSDFNREFGASIAGSGSLSELIIERLESPPNKGEIIEIDGYEFIILEPTLRSVKTVSVRSV